MEQQNKKRKRNEDPTTARQEILSPIIFLARGVKADTRFTVFRQEFHLHSSGLKHHSSYFRTFLDSVDKQPASASALFKYDYRSVVDEDGSWALMPVSDSSEITGQQMTLVDGVKEETEALRKLLCAIHSKKYRIETADELKRLTCLADYYCALPVVSGTLTGALFRSSMFQFLAPRYDAAVECECHDESVSLLLLARKLRHGLLFRECLIHTVGRWDSLSDIEKRQIEEDQSLYTLVQIKLKVLYELLAKTQGALLWAVVEGKFKVLKTAVGRSFPTPLIGGILSVYRALSEESSFYDLLKEVETMELSVLMFSVIKNNLALGCSRQDPGKVGGIFEKTFLCTEIEDDEFPWDLEEIDW
ncbi:uncharacterized protein EAE97_004899 [Botrytis byssoidea]|uniref:BTB domain-containing protein n=1 Tax=Botrytis byssoidea TaxID=139641 RepID=A0A9P5M0B4_9HELO|nr:uncharacterized protein EAE97_004899 [Botrytis byssoidea]KAF7945861.1 hypothetical protein EAE97_004899 [Botrytis byssoidea]